MMVVSGFIGGTFLVFGVRIMRGRDEDFKANHGFHRVPCSECGHLVACGSLYYAEAAALLSEGWTP